MVKDHGIAVFVEPSRVRSRRKHRFLEKTKSISTIFSFEKKKTGDGDVRYGVAERDLYIQKGSIYKKDHAKELGYYFTYAGVVLLITQYILIKPMINRLGEQNLIKIGILSMFAGFFVFPFATSFFWMTLANTPTLFGLAIANPSINSSLSKITDREDQGVIMGFNQSFASFMRIIGPMIGGLLLDINLFYPFYLGATIFILTFIFASSRLKQPIEVEKIVSFSPEPQSYPE